MNCSTYQPLPGSAQERVSHSEKEKSHLMMQQALITQCMQTGQPGALRASLTLLAVSKRG